MSRHHFRIVGIFQICCTCGGVHIKGSFRSQDAAKHAVGRRHALYVGDFLFDGIHIFHGYLLFVRSAVRIGIDVNLASGNGI